jgi:DNA primase
MNWMQLFRDYSIDHKERNDRLVCHCPHHTPKDVDFFMRVYPTGATTCWMCGNHSALSTIQELLQCTEVEAKKLFAMYSQGKVYQVEKKVSTVHTIELPQGLNQYERKYLHGRGITDSIISAYDLRGGGLFDDYWKYRIVIPVYQNGRIVSARGRTYVSDLIRYKGLSEAQEVKPVKHTLYAQDKVVGDTIVVVEGEFDAMRFGSPAVATYGTAFTDEQVILLTKYKKIYILFDGDSAGFSASKRLSTQLSTLGMSEVYNVSLADSPYKDIGAMPDDYISRLRKEIL